jgi:hypothetical protein
MLVWHGRTYVIDQIEPLDTETVSISEIIDPNYQDYVSPEASRVPRRTITRIN